MIEEKAVKMKPNLDAAEFHPNKDEFITSIQNPNTLRYFKFNLQQYCDILSKIIKNIEDKVEFINFLKEESLLFQKVIIDRDEFYSIFIETVLPTLIETSHKFSVLEETSKVIQKCVFSRNLHEFDCFLTRFFEEKSCSEKHSLCKTLFKFLSSLYLSDYSSWGYKLVFYSYSKSYKNFHVAYKLLVAVGEIIGFDVASSFNLQKIKYQIQQPSLNKSLTILNNIFDIITKLKFDSECKLNNVTLTEFIKNLLLSIISLSYFPNSDTYQIFIKVIEINPLIIESLINEIIIYSMMSDNTSFRKEYEEFIIRVLEVFNKLHRIQNFVSKLIPTLKSGIESRQLNEGVYDFRGHKKIDLEVSNNCYNVDDIFPVTVLNYFTNCVVHLASWQVINLFKTLLFHLRKAVEELSESGTEYIYIEILSALMCWVLQSVRMAEHTVATNTVIKFVGGLEELKAILGHFGKILLQKEHNQPLMKSFLNVCFYWGEIYITLEYYSLTEETTQITKQTDSNYSACNLTYLHTYLNDDQWCLISERINNFGGTPCKKIMKKLMIQKWRALHTFEDSCNEDITNSIVRELSVDLDDDLLEIFTDRFVVNNIIEKLPSNCLTQLGDFFVRNMDLINQPHIYDSEIIKNAIFTVVFTKINKLFKQKRKLDENGVRKSLFSKIMTTFLLPSDVFLSDQVDFEKIAQVVITDIDEKTTLDIKIHEKKIDGYFDILKKVPVIFCSRESSQKLFILLLLALHSDIKHSNAENGLQQTCESLIISVLQHSKYSLLDVVKIDDLLKLLTDNFQRSEDAVYYIWQNVLKNDTAVANFEPGIKYVKDNIKTEKCLKYTVVLINLLSRSKKVKMTTESRQLCSEYRSQLCQKLVKLIEKKSPEENLIEPYAVVLKIFLTKDENDSLNKLKKVLNDYVNFALGNLSESNRKGCLLLFVTILHNKNILMELGEDVVLRIWNVLKNVDVRDDVMEDYSQLVMLVATLIPNEQFSNIFRDLLEVTQKSVDKNDLCRHLKTWTCLVSTNFNPTKTTILREQLEFLLENLLLVLKSTDYKEELFEGVIQFEVSIIQSNHVPLTAAIMDFFLLTVPILMMKNCHDFVHCFNCSVSILEKLLKYRKPLIMDRLPPYLLQYRVLLKELCLKSSNVTLEENDVQKIADCSHKLERLTKGLVECSRDLGRIAMYLIADILGQYEQNTLFPIVKKHLDNCIYSLISLCDQHAVQYLLRVLSNASTEIFKFMYENYNKYYRFTGKI